MASGWESEGLGFEPRQLKAPFDTGWPKKQVIPSQKQCAFHEKKKFARCTLKEKETFTIQSRILN